METECSLSSHFYVGNLKIEACVYSIWLHWKEEERLFQSGRTTVDFDIADR